MVRHINTPNELEEAIEHSREALVVINAYATWCGPCQAVASLVQELDDECDENYIIYKVNIDEAAQVAQLLCITNMPTFIFFKHKIEVSRFEGADGELLIDTIETLKK